MPNKRHSQRVCHVNMLKTYVERGAKFLCFNTDVSEVSDVGPTLSQTQDQFSLDHLPERDRAQLKSLLAQFADILATYLAQTCVCTVLTLNREHVQLVSPEKSEQISKELDLMIKMGVIKESNSPWALPGLYYFQCKTKKLENYVVIYFASAANFNEQCM